MLIKNCAVLTKLLNSYIRILKTNFNLKCTGKMTEFFKRNQSLCFKTFLSDNFVRQLE